MKLLKILLISSFIFSYMHAHADTFNLISGEKISGELISFKDKLFEIKSSDKIVTLKKEEIKSIVFVVYKASSSFSTPKKTFEYWIKNAKEGNINELVKCYASSTKALKQKELSELSEKTINKMSKEAKKTTFNIFDPIIVDNQATLKVEKTFEEKKSEEFIDMVLENGEWKIVPEQ